MKADPPHELSHETEHERPGPINDVGTLNPHQMHPVLCPELDRITRVLGLLEPGERGLIRRDSNLLLLSPAVQGLLRRPPWAWRHVAKRPSRGRSCRALGG